MKYYYITICVLFLLGFSAIAYSDYLKSEIALKQLELKKIELIIKLKKNGK